jgi:flagellar hook-length control protein FliK
MLNITNNLVQSSANVIEEAVNPNSSSIPNDETTFGQMMAQQTQAKTAEDSRVHAKGMTKNPPKGQSQESDQGSGSLGTLQTPADESLKSASDLKSTNLSQPLTPSLDLSSPKESNLTDPVAQAALAVLALGVQNQFQHTSLKEGFEIPSANESLGPQDINYQDPANLLSPSVGIPLSQAYPLHSNVSNTPVGSTDKPPVGGIDKHIMSPELMKSSNLSSNQGGQISEFKQNLVTAISANQEQSFPAINPSQKIDLAAGSEQVLSPILTQVHSTHSENNPTTVKSALGSPSWSAEIGQKVVWMVGAADHTATLTLNPPDLGPLKVVVHVHNNSVNTAFISNNAEVRQVLSSGLESLRQSMAQSGINLGQTHVGSGNEQSQAALWQQQFSSSSSGSFSGQRGGGQGENVPFGDEKLTLGATSLSGLGRVEKAILEGLVNTFA